MFAKTSLKELEVATGPPVAKYLHAVRCRTWPLMDSSWRELDQKRFQEVIHNAQECFSLYEEIKEKIQHLKRSRHRDASGVDLDDDRPSIVHPAVADHTNGFGLHLRCAEAAINHVYLIRQICWALDNIYPRVVTVGQEQAPQPDDLVGPASLMAIRDIERAYKVLLRISASISYVAQSMKVKWNLVCCEYRHNLERTCWACVRDLEDYQQLELPGHQYG